MSLSNLICFSSNLLPMPSISLNFSCIQYFLGIFSLAGSDGLLSKLLLIRKGELLAVTGHVHPPLEWHKPIFTTSPTHCCDMRLPLAGPTNPLSRCPGSHPARLPPPPPVVDSAATPVVNQAVTSPLPLSLQWLTRWHGCPRFGPESPLLPPRFGLPWMEKN